MKKFLIVLVLVFGIALLIFFRNKVSYTQIDQNKEYFGISGFGPVHYPKFQDDDVANYWKDINSSANIYGVHTTMPNIDEAAFYSPNVAMPVYLLLKDTSIEDLDKLYKILNSNRNIVYVGIGNEINLLYKDDPIAYGKFLEDSKVIFPEIRSKFKNIKLFTVFQYESLIGNGFLFGEEFDDTSTILKDWEDIVDFFAFTLYPHFDFSTPGQIPDNYFDVVKNITDKDFAITETTWPSELNDFTGEYKDFNSSEQEQKEYLEWLSKFNTKYNPKFINWLFLNDIAFGNSAFRGAALRHADGAPKLIMEDWLKLVNQNK